MNYYSADTHAQHYNIILGHSWGFRRFKDVAEMDATMVTNINSLVGEKDTFWHLGDVAWTSPGTFLKQLKCRDIRIVLGNHDKKHGFLELKRLAANGSIQLFTGYQDIKVDDQKITLCHYPMRSWNCSCHGSWMLHGHVHGKITNPDPYTMDVGMDANDFKPVSHLEVVARMAQFKDHISI